MNEKNNDKLMVINVQQKREVRNCIVMRSLEH